MKQNKTLLEYLSIVVGLRFLLNTPVDLLFIHFYTSSVQSAYLDAAESLTTKCQKAFEWLEDGMAPRRKERHCVSESFHLYNKSHDLTLDHKLVKLKFSKIKITRTIIIFSIFWLLIIYFIDFSTFSVHHNNDKHYSYSYFIDEQVSRVLVTCLQSHS